jgi:soluble lytic murein transglycosylase-like protein
MTWSGTVVMTAAFFVLAASGLPPARAQFFERIDPDGTRVFTNEPHGAGWTPVAFPPRRSRTYRRRPTTRETPAQRLGLCDAFFVEAARIYQLPLAYLRAVAHVESRFDPRVVSVDGAMGIMQLMPFTARRMGVMHPFDARENILGGARFLRILANQWKGDLVLTTASYNAGAGAVARYRGVPPFRETRRYVGRVVGLYDAYRSMAAYTAAAR